MPSEIEPDVDELLDVVLLAKMFVVDGRTGGNNRLEAELTRLTEDMTSTQNAFLELCKRMDVRASARALGLRAVSEERLKKQTEERARLQALTSL